MMARAGLLPISAYQADKRQSAIMARNPLAILAGLQNDIA